MTFEEVAFLTFPESDWSYKALIETDQVDDLTLFVVFVIFCVLSWIWGFTCPYCSAEIWEKWKMHSSQNNEQHDGAISDASDFGREDVERLLDND